MKKKRLCNKVITAFDPTISKRSYYLVYTFLFLIGALFCFSYFVYTDTSLIWEIDGWQQHIKALVYYSKYLRGIVHNILSGNGLIIPEWDFTIGEGADILQTLHFYVIGDPISALSVFVPVRYMQYFYSFSCILRLYLAGISFSALCFGMGKDNRYGVMAGALSYSFCYWGVLNAARHPFFLTPMIWFPFVILGIEKIIRKERPYLFILSVMMAALSHFYFFYIIALLAAGYSLIRIAFMYGRKVHGGAIVVLRLGAYALIGACLAGIILLPVLWAFVHDTRLATASQPFHLFYPLNYYISLPAITVSFQSSYWLCLGLSAPVFLSVVQMFSHKKEKRLLKILFMVCVLITLFPIFGRALNGFSYMTNRWSWAFVLLCCFILADQWDKMIVSSEREMVVFVVAGTILWLALIVCGKSPNATAICMIPFIFPAAMLFHTSSVRTHAKQYLLIALVLVGSAMNSYWHFAPSAGNYASGCITNNSMTGMWEENEATIVKALSEEDPFARYSGRGITTNAHFVNGISSTSFYFSNNNPSTTEYRNTMEMREGRSIDYEGYDDRTSLLALSSIGYYVTNHGDNQGLPYGYELMGECLSESDAGRYALELMKQTDWDGDIYENRYPLPYGYCYTSCIDAETWNRLDAVQRQEIQLSAALIEGEETEVAAYKGKVPDYRVPFTIECKDPEIVFMENAVITTKDGAEATILLKAPSDNSETYFEIKGLMFRLTSQYELYFGDEDQDPADRYEKTAWFKLPRGERLSIRKEHFFRNPYVNTDLYVGSSAGVWKSITYRQPEAQSYSRRHDFIVNLGYEKDGIEAITVVFQKKGVYTFDDLNVYAVPMNGYSDKIRELQCTAPDHFTRGTDHVCGEICMENHSVLCLAIPYAEGWKAFVDGEERRVLRVNERNIGVFLPAGSHTFEFRYTTPLKREGAILSGVGILVAVVVAVQEERKRRRIRGYINPK